MQRLYQQVQRLIFSHFPHHPTQGQAEACESIVQFLYDTDPAAAFVLRGYAGTGKTSLISAIIQTAPALQLRTRLLAPTGRAAKVLANYSGRAAYTIHKQIYFTDTLTTGVPHMVRAINKHSYTLFIVDEASMIGLGEESPTGSHRSLLEDLIDYVLTGNHCRLLFIGDTAQLPPVGSDESPALDDAYLESISQLHVRSYELTEVVRQQQLSGILHNATRLRNQIVSMEEFDEIKFPLFDLNQFTDVVRLQPSDFEEVLHTEFGEDNLEHVALITRSNKRANLFNQGIRNRVLYREEEVNAGDYLMIVKNNYFWIDGDSGIDFVANGDIAEVLGVRNYRELYGYRFVETTLRFIDYPESPTYDCNILLDTLHSESPSLTYEESQKLYTTVMEDYADLPSRALKIQELRKNPYYNALQVKFSYALTCHKTQGGQWDTIIIDQGYLTDDMLTREYLRWLYTAFTRATRKVYLLNFEDRFFNPA